MRPLRYGRVAATGHNTFGPPYFLVACVDAVGPLSRQAFCSGGRTRAPTG
jgi:hypothetical protein